MSSFKQQQLEIIKSLGDILSFSFNLQEINRLVKEKKTSLIKRAEAFYGWQIDEIVKLFSKSKSKILFIAGPSSSGKTTSAYKIKQAMEKINIFAKVVSMDDFFLDREDTPLLPDGTYDFENVQTVDIPLFKSFLKNILNGKTAEMPFYDFVLGKRTSLTPFRLEKNEVIIVEGLHALNPIFFKDIPNKKIFKVYASVSSNFTISNEVVITPKDIRLMRRLLRDYYKRGKSPQETIQFWRRVSAGEDKFVIPFRTEANFLLNTTHFYEPLLYDKYLRPIIKDGQKIKELENVLNIFNHTGKCDKKYVPKHSLMQEFLPE